MRSWRPALVMREPLKWYDERAADNLPWLKALAELLQRAAREGYCYQHVQALTAAIDQYADRRLAIAITFSTSPTASADPRRPVTCRNGSARSCVRRKVVPKHQSEGEILREADRRQ